MTTINQPDDRTPYVIPRMAPCTCGENQFRAYRCGYRFELHCYECGARYTMVVGAITHEQVSS